MIWWQSRWFRQGVALTISISLMLCQTGILKAQQTEGPKVVVAFLGFQFDNLAADIQDIVTWRVEQAIMMNPVVVLNTSKTMKEHYGDKAVDNLLASDNLDAISTFAERNEFDYIFWGKLSGDESQGQPLGLNGSLQRLERGAKQAESFEISCSYDSLGKALSAFRAQYIAPLAPVTSRGSAVRKLVFVGLLVAGAMAVRTLGGGGAGGKENGGGNEGVDN